MNPKPKPEEQGPWNAPDDEKGPWNDTADTGTSSGNPGTPPPDKPGMTPLAHEAGQAIENFGIGALKGIGQTANNIGSFLIPDRLVRAAGGTVPTEEQKQGYFAPKNTAQSVGKGAEQAAEFLIPGGAEEEGVNAIARIAPKIKPIAKIGAAALSSGAVNKLQGGSFGTGAASGAFGAGMGLGLQKIAPKIAETAMGVQGIDRAYGRTPGEAILQDTRGIRPETVRASAQDTMNRLRPQVEQMARNSTNPADLNPVLQGLDTKIANAESENAPETAADIKRIREHFTTPKTQGAIPYVARGGQTSAEGALNLKRGLSKEFINRWTPEKGTDMEKTARSAYGQAADAFHAAVPEAKALDERMSSLSPIIDRAGMASRRPGVIQEMVNRVGAKTGGLAPMIAGGYGGAHAYGFPGALVGGALGLAAPAVFSSPEVQMFGARALGSPTVQRVIPRIAGASGLQFIQNRNSDEQK